MLVKDAMNRNVRVIGPGDTVLEAAKKMEEYGLGCLLVLENNKLVGIITERDILRKVILKSLKADGILVRDVMVKEVVTVSPEDRVVHAADLMNEKGVKKLPVVGSSGELRGIITATDIVAKSRNLTDRIVTLLIYQPEQTVALK